MYTSVEVGQEQLAALLGGIEESPEAVLAGRMANGGSCFVLILDQSLVARSSAPPHTVLRSWPRDVVHRMMKILPAGTREYRVEITAQEGEDDALAFFTSARDTAELRRILVRQANKELTIGFVKRRYLRRLHSQILGSSSTSWADLRWALFEVPVGHRPLCVVKGMNALNQPVTVAITAEAIIIRRVPKSRNESDFLEAQFAMEDPDKQIIEVERRGTFSEFCFCNAAGEDSYAVRVLPAREMLHAQRLLGALVGACGPVPSGAGSSEAPVPMSHREWSLATLAELGASEFERLVADLWKNMGYETTVTQSSRDGGVDVIATMDQGSKVTTYIQAKHYTPPNVVGVREVREYASLRHLQEVDAVLIVTTSGFSADALEEARTLKVKLVDGIQLVNLLNEHMTDSTVVQKIGNGVPDLQLESEYWHRGSRMRMLQVTGTWKLAIAGLFVILIYWTCGTLAKMSFTGFWREYGLIMLGLLATGPAVALVASYTSARIRVARLGRFVGLPLAAARMLVAVGLRTGAHVASVDPQLIADMLGVSPENILEIREPVLACLNTPLWYTAV